MAHNYQIEGIVKTKIIEERGNVSAYNEKDYLPRQFYLCNSFYLGELELLLVDSCMCAGMKYCLLLITNLAHKSSQPEC